jgi:hypothetical protein
VVDALDVPDNTIGLMARAHDTRPIVQDFVDLVPRLVAELADLAPSITPLGPAEIGRDRVALRPEAARTAPTITAAYVEGSSGVASRTSNRAQR